MNKLTSKEYWDSSYRRGGRTVGLPDIGDFRYFADRRIVETLEAAGLDAKNVMEVGAGDSSLLLLLAKRHPSSKLVGIDYSEAGCESLRSRAVQLQADVSVIQADMFDPPPTLRGQFDVVYSMGLVEHFTRLETVLAALSRFLRPSGVLITIIPNMSGVLGLLAKLWNRQVYDIHNPHDLQSFLDGHSKAGLQVRSSGYLCSTNFGVLYSCFQDRRRLARRCYQGLVVVSLGLWFLESRFFEFPKTAALSPYIYAVSEARVNGDKSTSSP